jgi:AraC-like DNA-binding protein
VSKPNHELVEQAEKLALANFQTLLDIPTLCRALAVNERTLRKAFQKIRGLPPCRRLRMLRLSDAKWALLSASDRFVTVTESRPHLASLSLAAFPLSTGICSVKVLRKRLSAFRNQPVPPQRLARSREDC